jgi:hypothetical protein
MAERERRLVQAEVVDAAAREDRDARARGQRLASERALPARDAAGEFLPAQAAPAAGGAIEVAIGFAAGRGGDTVPLQFRQRLHGMAIVN